MTPVSRHPRIFVQIPSYRDRECQWTIKDLFDKARHPERVFVGICWQFDPETDQDCFQVQACPDRVRRVDFHAFHYPFFYTDEVAEGLVQRCDIALDAARQRVRSQICHWQTWGVLGDDLAVEPGGFDDEREPEVFWPPRPPLDVEPIERTYRLLETQLQVRCFGADYDALAQSVLGYLKRGTRAGPEQAMALLATLPSSGAATGQHGTATA